MRRRAPAAVPLAGIPVWVTRFDPTDWPLTADGAGGHRASVRVRLELMDEARPLSAQHAAAVQRSAWHRARTQWAREHRVSLSDLIRSGQIEGVYDHLRRTPT